MLSTLDKHRPLAMRACSLSATQTNPAMDEYIQEPLGAGFICPFHLPQLVQGCSLWAPQMVGQAKLKWKVPCQSNLILNGSLGCYKCLWEIWSLPLTETECFCAAFHFTCMFGGFLFFSPLFFLDFELFNCHCNSSFVSGVQWCSLESTLFLSEVICIPSQPY